MIVVVTVDAVQHHITVIDPEQTVAHFDITEANALWHHFQNVAVASFSVIPDGKDKGILLTIAAAVRQ
ncbi:Uncharacterised protein [Escherichia coli]|nr:Uncharacterised protein [Escherichia coli]